MKKTLERRMPILVYNVSKFAFYAIFWAAALGVLVLMVHYTPKAVLALTDNLAWFSTWATENFAKLLWSLAVPEEIAKPVSKLGEWFSPLAKGTAWVGRKAFAALNDQVKAALSLVFSGFLIVSLFAWLSRLMVMPWLNHRLRSAILATATQEEFDEAHRKQNR